MKKFSLLFIVLSSFFSLAQTANSFSASAIIKNGVQPMLQVGKGFHINDFSKPTRSCFTAESRDLSNLQKTSGSSGASKSYLKIYYLSSDKEFQQYKSQDFGGKVSYLNFFNAGGEINIASNVDKHVSSDRLVFEVTVDFGLFEMLDPQLTPEAQQLISDSRLNDFVNMFGTHYLRGVQKGNTVRIICTRKISQESWMSELEGSAQYGASAFKIGANFEVSDYQQVNTFLSNSEFEISIETEGPSIDIPSLINRIRNILDYGGEDKRSEILEIVKSVKGINDENQAWYTRYYYAPWDLYGLQGIKWDALKEDRLSKINAKVVDLVAAKGLIEKYISDEYLNEFGGFFNEQNYYRIDELNQGLKNDLIPYLDTIDEHLRKQYESYISCSNVYCNVNDICCQGSMNGDYILDHIKTKKADFDLNCRMIEMDDIMEEYDNLLDCEKYETCDIVIENYSSNPYSLYVGDEYFTTIQGEETLRFEGNPIGYYEIKAEQNEGYMFYPTVNYRYINADSPCGQYTITVGYED